MTAIKRLRPIAEMIFLSALTVVMCVFSEMLKQCAYDALILCVRSVVPTIFPFMVVSTLLTRNIALFDRGKKTYRSIDLPRCAPIAILLGSLCGFPIGTACAVGLYKSGALRRSQAERLAAVSNHCSVAFVLGVVGRSFFGSVSVGIKLLLIEMGTSLVCGVAFLLLTANISSDERLDQIKIPEESTSLPCDLTQAISDAAGSVVRVCAFIVFFSVMGNLITVMFNGMPEEEKCAIFCVLEFTSGCERASRLSGHLGTAMSAFAISFSGLCVMSQNISLCAKEGIGMKKTFYFKLVQGVAASLIAYFII